MTDDDFEPWMLSRADADILDTILSEIRRLHADSGEERLAYDAAKYALESILARRRFAIEVDLRWEHHRPTGESSPEELPGYATVHIAIREDSIGLGADIFYDTHPERSETSRCIDAVLTADGSFDIDEAKAWVEAFEMRYGGPFVTLCLGWPDASFARPVMYRVSGETIEGAGEVRRSRTGGTL